MKEQQFNTFWHGNELSPIEWACLGSFIENGHKVRLFCYESLEVPDGVLLADASEISKKDDIFLFNGSISTFTDLFRYKLVSKYGEWWVDTDVYCLRDDIPACRYGWANQDADLINGALLKFPANDLTLHDICVAAEKIGRNATFRCEVGPPLLTEHLKSKRFDHHLGEREQFYPIHWLETFLLWLPGGNGIVQTRCRNSYFIHLWTSIFRQMGIDRYAKPPIGSFLEATCGSRVGRRFNLKELSIEKYDEAIEKIRAYCNYDWVVDCSPRLIGYNVGEFPFDQYISTCVR